MENKPGIDGTSFKLTLDRDWLTPSTILSLIPYQRQYDITVSEIMNTINKATMIIRKEDMTPEAQRTFEAIENKIKSVSRDIDNETETRKNLDYRLSIDPTNEQINKGWEKMEKLLDEHYPQQKTNNELLTNQDDFFEELEKMREAEKRNANQLFPYKQEKNPYVKDYPSKEEAEQIRKSQDDFMKELAKIHKREQERTTKHDIEGDVVEGVKESDGKLHIEYNWDFLEAQLKRMGKNKLKYDEGNWKKPMDINELKKALFRHVLCVMSDNFEDDGDKLGHLVAIALNSMFIHHQMLKNN